MESTESLHPSETSQADSNTGHDCLVADLKKELEESRANVEKLRDQAETQRAGRRKARRRVNCMLEEREEMNKVLQALQDDNSALLNRLQLHTATVQQMSKEADVRARSFSALEKQYRETIALLGSKTSELKDAHKFLGRVDNISDTEVLQMLKNLNSVIFQSAAHIADTMRFSGARGDADRRTLEMTSGESLIASVGEKTLEILLSCTHDGDPTFVQVALQARMVHLAKEVVDSWHFGEGMVFESVYERMKYGESASVSGRWRALSRLYLRHLQDHRAPSDYIQRRLVKELADVLFFSAVDGASNYDDLCDVVKSKFADNIQTIVELSLELQKAIGEDVISCDYAPTIISCGHPFNGAEMSDTFAHGKERRSGEVKVLCTVEMGITRMEKREGEQLHAVALSKPSVVLETIIEELQDMFVSTAL